MNTKKFRTRQEFCDRINPKGSHYIIGLDAGYSSMKVYYEGGYFCFPSFIKSVTEEQLTVPSPDDILYRDPSGLYMLGRTAQEMVESTDTNDTEGELFSRKRYGNRSFHIICNAALAIALRKQKDGRIPVIQTGLPTAYVDGDSQALKRALCQNQEFELKIGLESWKKYKLELKPENIYIMPQPAGSLYSALICSNGNYAADAKEFLFSNTLVMDIGFGTFDFYGIKSRAIACRESIDDIGMREVLRRTSLLIMEDINEDIRIPALQKHLETGVIEYVNEEEMEADVKDLTPYLEKSNEEVFKKAMEKAKYVTNTFRDYRYLIIGGGTGEAWYKKIDDFLKKMKTLHLIPSNRNDASLPFLYSNVRGYYLYRYSVDKKR